MQLVPREVNPLEDFSLSRAVCGCVETMIAFRCRAGEVCADGNGILRINRCETRLSVPTAIIKSSCLEFKVLVLSRQLYSRRFLLQARRSDKVDVEIGAVLGGNEHCVG